MPHIAADQQLLSYADGLIPNDCVVKLRVENKYAHKTTASGIHDGYPTYRIKLDGVQAAMPPDGPINQLMSVNVVPNPYFGYSQYENSPQDQVVKLTNLPPKCTVTIYTGTGQLVKTYQVNNAPTNNGYLEAPFNQSPADTQLDWDLLDAKGKKVGSGLYMIHINAPGVGERTIKWAGAVRG
jgi:hypothetical protein